MPLRIRIDLYYYPWGSSRAAQVLVVVIVIVILSLIGSCRASLSILYPLRLRLCRAASLPTRREHQAHVALQGGEIHRAGAVGAERAAGALDARDFPAFGEAGAKECARGRVSRRKTHVGQHLAFGEAGFELDGNGPEGGGGAVNF